MKNKYQSDNNQSGIFQIQDEFNLQNQSNNIFDFRSHDSFSDDSFEPVDISKKKLRVSPLGLINSTAYYSSDNAGNIYPGNDTNSNNNSGGSGDNINTINNNNDNNKHKHKYSNHKQKIKRESSQKSGYLECFKVISKSEKEYYLDVLTILFYKRKIEIYHSNNLIFTILIILINIESTPDHESTLTITSLNNEYILKFTNDERLKTFTKLFVMYKEKNEKKNKEKEQFLVSFSGNEAKKGLIIIKNKQIKLVLLYKDGKTIKNQIKDINFIINKKKEFILDFSNDQFHIHFMNNSELEQFTSILNFNK